jgi:hypothetical protein
MLSSDDHAAILAAILAENRAMHRKLDALLSRTGDAGERFCEAVLASWGTTWFPAADLLEWADQAPELRRGLRDAAQALCGTTCRPTSRQLGIALTRLSTIPMLWHRVEVRHDEHTGTNEYSVSELRD